MLAQSAKFSTCREVPDSNVGRDKVYPEVFSSPFRTVDHNKS
jgi:hypothetical protein